jgi:hypothetical protein
VAHQPTLETRKTVENASGLGIPQESIAILLEITPKTLRRKYRRELDQGKAKMDVTAGGQIAKGILRGDTGLLIFYARTRMGWKPPPTEITTPPDRPLETKTYVSGSPELLADYYAKIAQAAAAADTDPTAPRIVGPGGRGGDEPEEDPELGPR